MSSHTGMSEKEIEKWSAIPINEMFELLNGFKPLGSQIDMCVSEPLICHRCFPKKTNHNDSCEHAKQVYQAGFRAGHKTREIALSCSKNIEALKIAYRKHHLGDDSIGWDELSDILLDALCSAMGEEGYQRWLNEVAR